MGLAKQKSQPVSSGVEALIRQLQEEGVAKGTAEANTLVADAKAQAADIKAKAQAEADALRQAAEIDAKNFRSSAEDELRTVFRDLLLKLQEDLIAQFTQKIQRLISNRALSEEMIAQMIIETVGSQKAKSGVDTAKNIDVMLPAGVVGLDELRKNPDAVKSGPLSDVVLGATKELLRDGVTFTSHNDIPAGIKIMLKDEKVVVDLSDTAITAMIMAHLQPRFRALLEGAIK